MNTATPSTYDQDMANYAPRPHRSDAPRRSATTNHFTLHHALDAADGSITVRADQYLIPLANMANYAPWPHRSDAPRRSAAPPCSAATNHFTLHHALDAADGSIMNSQGGPPPMGRSSLMVAVE